MFAVINNDRNVQGQVADTPNQAMKHYLEEHESNTMLENFAPTANQNTKTIVEQFEKTNKTLDNLFGNDVYLIEL